MLQPVFEVVEARDGTGPHPCLVLLHGRGADEADLLGLAAMFDPRLYIVSLRAPLRLGPGYQWYESIDLGMPERASLDSSIRLVESFLHTLHERLPIDPARVLHLGFSQGAMMAALVRLAQPSRAIGSILLSGYLPHVTVIPSHGDLAGSAFFVAHGRQDPVLPVESGRGTAQYLKAHGGDVEYTEYAMGHQIIAPEVEAVNGWMLRRLAADGRPAVGNGEPADGRS
ncbi:MAG: alpha/beta fold hydrolase [Herpetosiphon sp.]